MNNVTPSALPRVSACLGSAVLPQADETTGDMRNGTAKHAHIERVANGMARADSLAMVPSEWRAQAAAIDLEPAFLRNGAAEVAFALNLARGTARELGRGLGRGEARARCTEGEMPMVVDWVTINGSEVFVADWKTNAAEHLMPAPKNAQLLTYMAAAFLAYQAQGITVARGALVRVDRDTPYWERTGALDALDVEAHLESIRTLLKRAKEAKERYRTTGELPLLVVSAACDWCPSRRFCPAQVGQLHEALGFQPKEGSEFGGPVLHPPEAGAMYAKVLGALEVLKRFKADLEGLAKHEPLPLPDGRVLRWEVETEASVDVKKATPLLERAYGPRVVELATKVAEPSMPWAKLSEALATEVLPRLQAEHAGKGRKPTRGALIKEARNMLEQNDAVRVNTYTVPRAVEAPNKELEPSSEE